VQFAAQRSAPLRVSLNVSARQLSDPGLVRMLRDALTQTGCRAGDIAIEVTETVVLHDISAATTVLEDIKALGVDLDLDDFGTGYSSLLYLKHFPVDRIKIDMSFVAGLGTDMADTAIVASTIALAHSVGLTAIAEGVETPEQLTLLRQLGCDFAQGYLLCRPLPQQHLAEWLDRHVPSRLLEMQAVTSSSSDVAALSRDLIADQRDTVGDLRDDVADEREQAGDRRDAAGELRDDAGDKRDIGADHRDQSGDARDRAGDQRDDIADDRDRLADQRDRAADQRDQDAATHLSKVTSAPAADAEAVQQVLALSAKARREAAEDRTLALEDRGVGAGARMQAERDRDAASADRGTSAGERADADRDRTQARADRAASAHDRHVVSVDALTGVLVQDSGMTRLRDAVDTAGSKGSTMSLAFVCLDEGGMPGEDGQVATDSSLVLMANGLRAVMREEDVLFRHGHGGFVCAFPGVAAAAVAKRLAAMVRTLAGPPRLCTVTVRVAECVAGDTVDQLIQRAEGAPVAS
jgi:predicted signal transduction protein with EAL and GGDEF domain